MNIDNFSQHMMFSEEEDVPVSLCEGEIDVCNHSPFCCLIRVGENLRSMQSNCRTKLLAKRGDLAN